MFRQNESWNDTSSVNHAARLTLKNEQSMLAIVFLLAHCSHAAADFDRAQFQSLQRRIGAAFDSNDFKLALELSAAAVTLAGHTQPYLTVSGFLARHEASRAQPTAELRAVLCCRPSYAAPHLSETHHPNVGSASVWCSASLMPAPFSHEWLRSANAATSRCWRSPFGR